MKIRKYLFAFIGLFVFSSCQDMFEPADENNRQEDAMIQESDYAHGLLIYGYSRMPYVTTTQTDVATDDAVINTASGDYYNMTTGSWAADSDPMTLWNRCKDGIQYVNLFLTKVEKVKWALSSEAKNQMFTDRLKGEALGLRAIFYYHLLQAHGGYADDGVLYGVPLFTQPEDAGSDYNQPRATFAECVQQCFADCDAADNLLPFEYKDIDSSDEIPAAYKALHAELSGYNLVFGDKAKGLLSGKVAKAVKAQVALLAISPAFREQSGVTAAEAAVIIANSLKDDKGNSCFDQSGNIWYMNKSKIESVTKFEIPEIVWRGDRTQECNQEKDNFPPSLFGKGLVNPTQNLVDAFPMASGLPITDPASGYDPQNPYANRDPRLANTVVYHGMLLKGKEICTGVNIPTADGNVIDNLNRDNSTRTGYYLLKLLRQDVNVSASGSFSDQYHVYPRIRYTELFLAFAEAANEAWGPDQDPQGLGFTAYSVIKMIRERAGLGKEGDVYLERCRGDKDLMTQLIRNERRIELCFENKRFWDLRRWKMDLTESAKGVKVELDPTKADGSLTYTVFDVDERKFDNSYQCYGPIPKVEVLKWSNLKQNKGWK